MDFFHTVFLTWMDRDTVENRQSFPLSGFISYLNCEDIYKTLKCDYFFPCQAVEDRQLEIIPHFYTKTWKNWLSNIR